LSTVYGIITQHDGYVAVERELGRGSTFTVYFPRVEAPPDATEPLTASVPSPRRSERILLVEDEPAVRAVAQESLAAKGYAVLEAKDVDDALRLAREDTQPIDLLVTDVVMPVMNGRQLAERIQALHPEAQVLYMSGYIDDAIVHHGVLEGGTAFLQKPFTPADLARRVREMLDAETDRRRAGFRA
jgi:CheY-like chemotaxis protein